MSQAPYSSLEVVPHSEALEAQKYAYYAPAPEVIQYHQHEEKIPYSNVHEQDKPQTICGIRKRTFWIIVLVAVIVVAAAVGGGVGGALASKSSNGSNNDANSTGGSQSSGAPQILSTTPTPTSSQSSTVISTTTMVGPSSTILRDCPSSNYTLYDVTLGDTKMTFRKACDISFLNANGIDSVVGKPVASLNDCINACALYNVNNKTQIEQGGRICNSVCWRNTFDSTINDWPGGMCFGFTSLNSSGTFRYRQPAETRCDSAALINQVL